MPSEIDFPASRLLGDRAAYCLHQIERNPYGDGRSAPRIVELMLRQGWQAAAGSRKLHEAA